MINTAGTIFKAIPSRTKEENTYSTWGRCYEHHFSAIFAHFWRKKLTLSFKMS
jgi:hypothetical protein